MLSDVVKQLVVDLTYERECVAVLVREPLIDPYFPKTSDIDVVLVDMSDDFGVENIRRMKDNIRFDIMAMSAKLLLHDDFTRWMGTLPHQLIACKVAWEEGNYGTKIVERMREIMGSPDSVILRLKNHFLYATQILSLAEKTSNPSEAFCYLNAVASGFIAFLCDGKTSLINVHTKPYQKLMRVEPRLLDWFKDVLRLETFDFDCFLEFGEMVCGRFKDFAWDDSKANREFSSSMLYFPHMDELRYRMKVMNEVLEKRDLADAAHYGRIYAYTLLCADYFLDRLDQVDKSTSYLRSGKVLAESRNFNLFSKIFPFSEREVKESIERLKIFRREKMCPTLV